MTIKHLPGQHNQKLHAGPSRQEKKKRQRERRGSKEDFAKRTRALLRAPEDLTPILVPSPGSVKRILHKKYSWNRYADNPREDLIEAAGFNAAIASISDTIQTEIEEVTDPIEAEAYVR